MKEQISAFHKRNLILWGAILFTVIALTIVTYILNSVQMFQAIEQGQQISQILFIIAIVLAGAILLFKRSAFVPTKFVQKLSQGKADRTGQIFSRLRRNYLIVWSMGEAICLVGFVNFVITADFNSYLIFAVVSAYSLLINIPSEAFVYKSLEILGE